MAYRHLTGLTPDGVIYINDNMGTTEAMLPTGGYQTAHAPCMLEMPDGDLLLAWFAGSYEGGTDINIVCSRLPKGAEKWEEPVQVSDDPERSDQNPSLFLGPDGAAWAMYTSQLGRKPGVDNMQFTSQIRCQKSFDHGKTWSSYETVFPEEGTFARQEIQVLSNGRWIYGNWICRQSPDGLAGDPSAFKISDDAGKTWRHVDMPNSRGRVHPNVVELENGHLLAFMRSRLADHIYRSESFDYGDSWSEPVATELPNNNSSISAIRLKSGRIAIAYNPTSAADAVKNGSAWPGLRCPVAVALSEDNGNTFPMIRNMERGEGYTGKENQTNNRQYEYPYLLQAADGSLHLTFAYQTRRGVKWMTFTEEDVMGARRGNSVYNPTSGEVDKK
jgi:predicted neuraminidase